jgi:hypothetical protein
MSKSIVQVSYGCTYWTRLLLTLSSNGSNIQGQRGGLAILYGCHVFAPALLLCLRGQGGPRLILHRGEKRMSNLIRLGVSFLAGVLVLALMPSIGLSQNVYGTIAGTVTDTSGALRYSVCRVQGHTLAHA